MTNVTKLTSTNFVMWSRQVHALFDGYDLAGHIDGSIIIPPPTLTTEGIISTNPAYTLWKRQDRLLFSALIGAVSTSLQPILSTASTAAEIWTTLSDTYAKPSRAHFKQLKHQLKYWKKDSKTIDEYLQGLTTRFDQIALLGKPLDHEDQIEYVIDGLPEDYKTVIDQIESRDTPPSLTEVHERLLNHEVKLQTVATEPVSAPITANAATHTGHKPHNNNIRNQNRYAVNNRQGNRQAQTWQQQSFTPRQDNRNSRGYQGRCQICSMYGHSARTCSQLQQHGSSSGTGYTSAPWQPRANLAAAPYSASNWILDSGATHHLTSDLNNLSLHQPYNGGEEITIADGSGLAISHTGSSILPTPSQSLALRDVLYVPNVHKNLISLPIMQH